MISEERITEIGTFIDTYILHSSVWDEAEQATRVKAINNSALTLTKALSRYFETDADIPVDVLANQVVWLLRIDDTFLRADLGATYIQMSGVMVNIAAKDRSIAPYVLDALDITPDAITGGLTRRKVGRYAGPVNGADSSIFRRE